MEEGKKNLHKIYQESGIIQARNKMLAHLNREFYDNHDGVINKIPCSEVDKYLELLGQLARAIAIKWDVENAGNFDFDWSPDGDVRRGCSEDAKHIIQDKLCPKVFNTNPA